jgi:universal stress protein A
MARVALSLQLARGTGASVVALYVVDDRLLADPDAGLVRETLDAQLVEEGKAVLAQAAQLAEGTARPLVTRLERGLVVETILRVAEDINADVIVVGSHKQTWLGRLLGGSLAESILRAANCAVLAVPPAKGA